MAAQKRGGASSPLAVECSKRGVVGRRFDHNVGAVENTLGEGKEEGQGGQGGVGGRMKHESAEKRRGGGSTWRPKVSII
jgi:hypothetical protein